MTGALDGIRVLDLTSHLSGPYAAMILGDQGADVIKIENPEGGDHARAMPPFIQGESAPFMIWNRNKRSVTLDLKSEEGMARFMSLVDTADVIIENFRPGVAARLGIDYATLSKKYPSLVYCSISGFGQSGPYTKRGGFDLIMQGMTGLMSACGPADGPPHRVPPAISDVTAGMNGAIGILCALNARHVTGKGQQIDISLFESCLSLGVYEIAEFFATDTRPARLGQQHRASAPYQVFKTRDGWITFGASGQHHWASLCQIIKAPELQHDSRFAENKDRVANNAELVVLIQERLEQEPSDHWLAQLDDAGIPAGPVLEYDEVLTNEHTLARDMVVEVEHQKAGKGRNINTPIKLLGTAGGIRHAAPSLGQHNDDLFGSD